jgi:hypothetical protein
MSDLRVYDFDATTGEGNYRDLTAEELEEHKANEKLRADCLAEAEAKATAKTELLAQLGITEEQAKLLLGGN